MQQQVKWCEIFKKRRKEAWVIFNSRYSKLISNKLSKFFPYQLRPQVSTLLPSASKEPWRVSVQGSWSQFSMKSCTVTSLNKALYLSLSLSVCLSVCVSVSLCLCLSVCVSVSLSLSLSLSVCLSLSFSLSLCLSVCLFLSLSLSLSWGYLIGDVLGVRPRTE